MCDTNRYVANTAPSTTACTPTRWGADSSSSDAGTTSTAAPDLPPARTSAAAACRSVRDAPAVRASASAPVTASTLPHPTNTTDGSSWPNDPWAPLSSTTAIVWPALPLNPRWRARAASSVVDTARPPTLTTTVAGTPRATLGPSEPSSTGTPTTATGSPAVSATAAGSPTSAHPTSSAVERVNGMSGLTLRPRCQSSQSSRARGPCVRAERVPTCSPSCERAMVHTRSDSRLR